MLEARVDVITQYNDKILAIKEDLAAVKEQNARFKDLVVEDIAKATERAASVEAALQDFIEKEAALHKKVTFWNDEKNHGLEDLQKNIETVKLHISNKFTDIDFSLGQRVRTDDFKQNL